LIYDLNPEIYTKIGQYNVAVFCGLNCPDTTELAVYAMKKIDCDFCLFWVYNLDSKTYVCSMRAKDNVDVSLIAKSFGGGGHKQACAFSFSSTKYNISDLFEGKSLYRKYI
jgi:nanoRNase/pAp phosphatase (c-di-AMP/oligoRNAs hydrolase)